MPFVFLLVLAVCSCMLGYFYLGQLPVAPRYAGDLYMLRTLLLLTASALLVGAADYGGSVDVKFACVAFLLAMWAGVSLQTMCLAKARDSQIKSV